MAYHIAYKWNQPSSRIMGWLETFWCTAADWVTAKTRAGNLFNLLHDVHGEQANCYAFRLTEVADIPVRGGSRLSGVFLTGTPIINVTASTATTDADYPSTALQLNLSSGGGAFPNGRGPTNTTQWIRGIPDNQISDGGRFVENGAWSARLTALLRFLEAPGNQITQRVNNPNIARQPITAFFPITGMMTAPGHGVAVDAVRQVRISGIIAPYLANGLRWVQGLTDDTLQLLGWTADNVTAAQVGNSWLRRQQFTYPLITEASIVRSTSHYTGKPTASGGGRRRRRRTVSA